MQTQELSETYTFNNNSFEKQGKGYLFYIAPQLVRFDAVYYKPSVTLYQLLEAKESGHAAESALRVSGIPTYQQCNTTISHTPLERDISFRSTI